MIGPFDAVGNFVPKHMNKQFSSLKSLKTSKSKKAPFKFMQIGVPNRTNGLVKPCGVFI